MPEEQKLEKLFRSTEELDQAEEAHINGNLPSIFLQFWSKFET